MQEINPELAAWSGTIKTNAILADIYDVLVHINANLVAHASGKPAKNPKLYPRPGQKEAGSERHFGRGALPAKELREWFEKKRTEKCQK